MSSKTRSSSTVLGYQPMQNNTYASVLINRLIKIFGGFKDLCLALSLIAICLTLIIITIILGSQIVQLRNDNKNLKDRVEVLEVLEAQNTRFIEGDQYGGRQIEQPVLLLDSNGLIPEEKLPKRYNYYKGCWNARDNAPKIPTGNESHGDFYRVCVPGPTRILDKQTNFKDGEMLIFTEPPGIFLRIPGAQSKHPSSRELMNYNPIVKDCPLLNWPTSAFSPFKNIGRVVQVKDESNSTTVYGQGLVLDQGSFIPKITIEAKKTNHNVIIGGKRAVWQRTGNLISVNGVMQISKSRLSHVHDPIVIESINIQTPFIGWDLTDSGANVFGGTMVGFVEYSNQFSECFNAIAVKLNTRSFDGTLKYVSIGNNDVFTNSDSCELTFSVLIQIGGPNSEISPSCLVPNVNDPFAVKSSVKI